MPARGFSRRARHRLVCGAVAVAVCVAPLAVGRAAAGNGPTADQIADQILAVQAKADAAAGQWTQLDETAKDKYTGAMPQFIPFTSSVITEVETDALTVFALGTGAVDLDQFAAAQRDLARKQDQLTTLQQRNSVARDRVQTKRDDLDAQIGQLQTLESQLRDAEVKKAYEAKL